MAEEPRSPEPPSGPAPESDDERKPLHQRATAAWNKLGSRTKVATAIGVAAVVVGGIIAAAQARTVPEDDEGKTTAGNGVLAEVARILDQAAAKQDDDPNFFAPSPWHPSGGDVGGYWRNQCLNPRGHATGNCRHERRWVPDHKRGASQEESAEPVR